MLPVVAGHLVILACLRVLPSNCEVLLAAVTERLYGYRHLWALHVDGSVLAKPGR
jgi:hypothetical protein